MGATFIPGTRREDRQREGDEACLRPPRSPVREPSGSLAPEWGVGEDVMYVLGELQRVNILVFN